MAQKYQIVNKEAIREGKVAVNLSLPIAEILNETEAAVEQLVGQAGLKVLQAIMEDEQERLTGEKYAHPKERRYYRWGAQSGYVVFAGKKVGISHPRVKTQKGREVKLASYRSFQKDSKLSRQVLERVVCGVSTRKYRRVVSDVCEGYSIDKSSVSRHSVKAMEEMLKHLLEKDLTGLALCVLLLDGVEVAGQMLVVALGVTHEGEKHVLGLWQGATENAEVCKGLLEDLIRRGLKTEQTYLFVLDGSKALRAGVERVFGEDALIQRCQQHKRRNVRSYLPPELQGDMDRQMRSAYAMTDYEEARQALQRLLTRLERINPSAARSLEEGLEETLTLHRLGVPELLRRSLSTTNLIESCFSQTEHITRRVTRWRDGYQIQRWYATALCEAQRRFHKVQGHSTMPYLVKVLKQHPLERKKKCA